MFQMTANELSELRKLAEENDCRVAAYSGRGMMGKNCLSISGTEEGIDSTVANFLLDIMQQDFDHAIDTEDGEEEATRAVHDDHMHVAQSLLTGRRRDNLGLSVVWYWPNVAAPNES